MSPDSGRVRRWTRREFLRAAGVSLAGGVAILAERRPARALTINPRSSWATDRPPKGPLAGEDVKFLIVHHSASRNGHTPSQVPAILRSFFDYHTSAEKGWNDIAYNFLIDSSGGIWEGRSGSIAGAVAGDATGGNQGFSQLVCLIGDFNAAEPSAPALESLTALLAWLADKHAVATSPGAEVSFTSRGSNLWPAGAAVTTPTITGHRTMSSTSCPGANLNQIVTTTLTAGVHAARAGVPPVQSSTTTSTTPMQTTTVPMETTIPTVTTVPTETTIAVDPTTTQVAMTTTAADPIPTAGTDNRVVATVAKSSPTAPTVVQVAEAGLQPVAESSAAQQPLVWTAAALGVAATAGLAWRYRRMGD